jgi:hypothetical protein
MHTEVQDSQDADATRQPAIVGDHLDSPGKKDLNHHPKDTGKNRVQCEHWKVVSLVL